MNGFQNIPLVPGTITLGPLSVAAVVASLTILLVVGLVVCAKPFDGTGTLAQSAVVVAWVQVVQLLLQVVQLILSSVSVAVAAIFGLVATFAMIWVLINFIDGLHNLQSKGRAVVVFLLSVVGIALGLSFILTLTGLAPMSNQTL